MLFRSNLDSGLKRKLYVYILFGFLQKGDVWGKNVCSPRPAPTMQPSLLHSTKPKEPFKRKGRKPGADPFSQIQAGGGYSGSGLTPWETEKKSREPRSKTSPERDGFSPEWDAGKNFN